MLIYKNEIKGIKIAKKKFFKPFWSRRLPSPQVKLQL